MNPLLGWFLTFHFFNFTTVIFRATSWDDVWKIYKGMFGFSETSTYASIDKMMGADQPWFFSLASSIVEKDIWATWLMTGMVVLFVGVMYFCPNSMELRDRFKPGKVVLIAQVFMFIASVLMITKASEFLYFQF